MTIDYLSKLTENSTFIQKLIGIKSKKWDYEEEIRIVTSKSGKQFYDFRAVKAIYFGLRMDEAKQHEIMKKLKGRGIKYFQIELESDSYKLKAKEIKDHFQTDTKYLYSIAPIAELAFDPNSLNEKWKSFAPYLQKVAEIVRRDSYCNELLLVDIGADKSKPNEPIFFGQFERTKYRFENQYFTVEEVDELYAQIEDLSIQKLDG